MADGFGGNLSNNGLYVHYGCGFDAPEKWLNYDSSSTLRFERLPIIGRFYTKNKRRFPENTHYGNIVTGLPVKIGSCDGIYCSHVLEHLSLKDFRKALKNTYAYLKPNGIFRLVVPDLHSRAKEYLRKSSENDNDASMEFMKSSGLGFEDEQKGTVGVIYEAFRSFRHKWMWDYRGLQTELIRVGFMKIRKCKFNDSADKRFKEVENSTRFKNELSIECRKSLKWTANSFCFSDSPRASRPVSPKRDNFSSLKRGNP